MTENTDQKELFERVVEGLGFLLYVFDQGLGIPEEKEEELRALAEEAKRALAQKP